MPPIRRTDRTITADETRALLADAEYGVLSTVGSDGQPYGIPLSFVLIDNRLYFHCALSGHKLDNLAHNPRVSFCVVGKTKVLPEKFATEYESAVVFGRAAEVEGEERYQALVGLLEKYCAAFIAEGKGYIEQKDKATRVYRIDIDNISGKARR